MNSMGGFKDHRYKLAKEMTTSATTTSTATTSTATTSTTAADSKSAAFELTEVMLAREITHNEEMALQYLADPAIAKKIIRTTVRDDHNSIFPTAFHVAAYNGRFRVMKRLLEIDDKLLNDFQKAPTDSKYVFTIIFRNNTRSNSDDKVEFSNGVTIFSAYMTRRINLFMALLAAPDLNLATLTDTVRDAGNHRYDFFGKKTVSIHQPTIIRVIEASETLDLTSKQKNKLAEINSVVRLAFLLQTKLLNKLLGSNAMSELMTEFAKLDKTKLPVERVTQIWQQMEVHRRKVGTNVIQQAAVVLDLYFGTEFTKDLDATAKTATQTAANDAKTAATSQTSAPGWVDKLFDLRNNSRLDAVNLYFAARNTIANRNELEKIREHALRELMHVRNSTAILLADRISLLGKAYEYPVFRLHRIVANGQTGAQKAIRGWINDLKREQQQRSATAVGGVPIHASPIKSAATNNNSAAANNVGSTTATVPVSTSSAATVCAPK